MREQGCTKNLYGCLSVVKQFHAFQARYWDGKERFYYVDRNRTVIEECDVGATL